MWWQFLLAATVPLVVWWIGGEILHRRITNIIEFEVLATYWTAFMLVVLVVALGVVGLGNWLWW